MTNQPTQSILNKTPESEYCQVPVPRSKDNAATTELSEALATFRLKGWPHTLRYDFSGRFSYKQIEADAIALIQAGAYANDPSMQNEDSDGHWLIHEAAILGSSALMATLLGAGAEPEARDKFNNTALMYAASHGGAKCLRLLLNAGADPLADSGGVGLDDWIGWTPVHAAAEAGNHEILSMLLEAAGPDADFECWYEGLDSPWQCGTTPLMAAAAAGSIECCEILLGLGADIGAEGEVQYCEQTALDVATADVLAFLIAWGERDALCVEATQSGNLARKDAKRI
jgi:ankyrin repeat protein